MKASIKIMKGSLVAIVLMLLLNGNAFSQCLTYSIQDVTCNGGSDGSVTITINNPGTNYNFSVFGAFGSRTFNNSVSNIHTFINLPAEPNLIIVGQYKVGASFISCPPFFAAINEPSVISVTGTVTNILCNGGNTGAIDITVSGGNPGAYTYSWSNGPTSQDISNLTVGNYTVITTDSKGCKDTTSFTVTQQSLITIPASITDVKCNGENTGAIDISPAGGTAPYTYSWSNGAVSQDISALIAGTYSVTLTDANSCTKNASFTVNQPPVISVPGTTIDVSCNGGSDGSIDITPAGGTPPYTYLWSNGAVSQDISALIAGTYSVTVTDANSCTKNVSFTINQPSAISVSGTTVDVSCNGGSNGSIDITPAGGTPPYTYLWSNGAVSQDISALAAGNYSVTVTDSKSCTKNVSFTINQPAPITVPGTTINVSCNGGSNGSIDITPAGGTAPYTYLWSNGAVSQDISALTAGTYSVTVTDAKSCAKNVSFTITQPAVISIPGTTVNVSCNGGNNGSIDITPAGGTGAYTYVWSNGASTQDISNLIAGTYTITVKDTNLCSKSASFTITQPAAITIPGVITNVTCHGGNNGAVDITPAGGTVAYTYIWNTGASTQDISGLTAGLYTVILKDAKQCSKIASFTVTEPAAITIPGTTTNNICNGGSAGAIDITPANGTAPYTYFWSNGALTQDISGLIAGTYTVTVTDAKSCTKNASFTINQPAPITVPGTTIDVSCNGGSNGSIDITPAGGTAPYTYLWSNGAVSQDIAALIAGIYSVTVRDANGCTQNASFTINQPPVISVPGTTIDVSCNGGSDGSIDITPAGGTPPYTYLWSNGAVSQDISALIAGTYSVTVTDSKSCTKNASFTINQPSAISVPGTTVDVSCNGGSNGSIDITPAGGTAPYTYLWSNGTVTQDISALTAGNYSVTVTDSKSCTKNVSFTINQPAPITVPGTTTNVSCNGGSNGSIDITPAGGTLPYTYLWSNGAVSQDISGLAAGNYSVTVTDSKSCTKNVSFTITQPALISVPGTTINVSCNGGSDGSIDITPAGGTAPYTYLWSNGAVSQDISGLTAATYSVTVTDANGCTKNSSFTINQPAALSVPGTTINVTCNGGSNGSIDITPAGGTPPYTYSWSNGAVSQDISALIAGTYSVTVTDAKSCTKNVSFTITQPGAAISVPGTTIDVSCNGGSNGSIDITPAGGTAPYTYLWSNGAVSQDISALIAGTYSVTVTDAKSCTKNASFTINQPAPITVPGTTIDVFCNGGSNGSVDITPAGGTAPYSYLWSNGAVSQDISGLIAGTYSVTITDANSCTKNASFTINQPAVISVPGTTIDVSCNGGSDGSIDITPAGGTAPYTYLWSNGAASQDISALIAGTYSVTVTDAKSCTKNVSFTINQPAPITVPGTSIDVSCNGGNNGSIDITPAGGTAPYTYLWSNGAVSQDISTLTAGNYSVTVTDSKSCTKNVSFTINQPAPITVPGNITDVTCNGGNNGTVDITPAGGTGSYTYAWNTGASTQNISNLVAGTYSVTVTDGNSCSQNASFTVSEPVAISIPGNITSVSCNGGNNGAIDITPVNGTGPGTYTYLWSNGAITEDISGLTAGSYTVTVTDANSCSQNASFTVNQATIISAPGNISNVSCKGGNNGAVDITPAGGAGPYTFAWSNGASSEDVSGLTAGAYSVTITDANLCSQNFSFTVTEPAALTDAGSTTDVTCNGGNNGAVDITPAGGTAPYNFTWSTGATTEDIGGLIAGIYSVTVTDGDLCSQNISFTINEPAPITIPGTTTDEICNGGNNGNIDITPSGGVGPYSYLWNNLANSTTQDISSLTAGTYTVTVTDASLCTANATFTINEPAAIAIPGNITDANCNGGNNGAIDITPANGTGPGTYTYLWSTGATTEDISGLTAGSYTVTVTDANSCSQNASFTVNQATNISAPANFSNVSCNGGSDGAIDITPAGGTGPGTYTFAWSNGSGTEDISGLIAGPYSVIITDGNSCSQNFSFTVNEPAVISIPGNITDNICNGGNTGVIDITPAGGSGPGTYIYAWSNGAVTEDISGLTAGLYSVNITDAKSCSQNASFTVNEPSPVSAPGSITDVTCNGGNNGAIDITPAGGTGSGTYTFVWNNGASSEDISGLIAGPYSVIITDGNRCSKNIPFTVSEPPVITGTAFATPDTVCLGDPSMITANLDPAFIPNANAYSFDGGITFGPSNTFNISSINSDTTVKVVFKDVNGCISAPLAVSISVRQFIASLNLISPTCNGSSTGSININSITGGTAPYTYALNGNPGISFTNLTAGSYTLSVTDALSCRFDTVLTLTEPPALNLSATFNSPICSYGNNGTVTLNASGGTVGYTYSNDNITYAASNVFSGLNPGTYTYYVKDGNGCIKSTTATFASFPPVDIASINANIINLTCNNVNTGQIHLSNITGGTRPLTFSLNGGIPQSDSSFIGLASGPYTIFITDANGCSFPYNFNITSPAAIDFNLNLIKFETCNNADGKFTLSTITGGLSPFNYSYSFNGKMPAIPHSGDTIPFSNLSNGIYTVEVFDVNAPGCSSKKFIILPKKPAPIPYVRVIDPLCYHGHDGQIKIDSLQGGAPLFKLALNGKLGTKDSVSGVTSAIFSGLAKDTFQLTITDQECIYPMLIYYLYNEDSLYYDTLAAFIVVDEPDTISGKTFSSNTDRDLSVGAGYIYSVQGGTGPYSYSLTLGGPYTNMTTDTTMISGLGKGHYKAYIKDTNGCLGIVEFDVHGSFFIPNLITPNGDKSNDIFEIIGLPRESELKIYNRWGARVYENKSYDNTWAGEGNPDGVYYYDLILPDKTLYKGWVEVLR
jgi:gliding motility-associated-like protein